MCCGREATRSTPPWPPCSCRSWPSRRSPGRAPAASCWCTRRGARATCWTSSWRRPGRGLGRARARAAGADRRGVRRGRAAAVQLRALLVRRLRDHRRPGRGAAPVRHPRAGRRHAPRPPAPRGRGWRSWRCRRSCWASSARSCAPRPRPRRCTSPTAARCAPASCFASPSWATCWSGSAPRAPASSTAATWPLRSATGCWSGAGCSRAPTSSPTRSSSARRRRRASAAAGCSPTRRRPPAGS